MNNLDEWNEFWDKINEAEHRPPQPKKTNKEGGFDPKPSQFKKWKKLDLITLPPQVSGTNCFNCEYIEKKTDEVGWCKHEEVLEYVGKNMCCKLWNHPDVKRLWEKTG